MRGRDQEHIESLSRYGFQVEEASVYLELLKRSEVTASDLHRLLSNKKSRQTTYHILVELVQRGFVNCRLEGRRKYYTAIPPKELHSLLLLRREREKVIFDQMQEIYEKGNANGQNSDFFQVIQNDDIFTRRFVKLIDEAKESIHAFVRSPFVASDPVLRELQLEAFERAMDRGVPVYRVLSADDMNNEVMIETISRAHEKHHIRIGRDLPAKMTLFDKSILNLAVPVTPGDTRSTYWRVVMRDASNARVYYETFQRYWDESLPYEKWLKRHG